MKRLIWMGLLLLTVLSLCLFVGCDEEEGEQTDGEETVEDAQAEGEEGEGEGEEGGEGEGDGPALEYEFEVAELEPIYAMIEMHSGSYDGFALALEEMTAALADAGIEAVGPPFGVYYSDPAAVPEDELQWLLGIPVAEGTAALEGYEADELEGGTVVKTTLAGELDFENLTVYDELYAYVAANGYVPAGPMVEVYRWGPELEPDEYETDFMVFVEEAGAVSPPPGS